MPQLTQIISDTKLPLSWQLPLSVAGGVIAAVMLFISDWQAKDLLWALWSSSLVVGYLSILLISVVINFATPSTKPSTNKSDQVHAAIAKKLPKTFLGKLSSTVFLIAFFTVHFGLFHAVHAVFLSGLTGGFLQNPAVGIEQVDAVQTTNKIEWLIATLRHASWFILCTAIAQLPLVINHIRHDIRPKKLFMMPYANVIKMHIMIFLLVPVMLLGSSTVALLVVVIVFFMPLKPIWQWWRSRSV